MHFDPFHLSGSDSPPLRIPALGLAIEIKRSQQQSRGAMTIIETNNEPSSGPPLHRHRETEIFRVLVGSYGYEVDGQRFTCAAGDWVSVPGGMVHGFRNIGEDTARQIVMIVPGMDVRLFFGGLARLMKAGQPTPDQLNDYGRAWAVEFLGPPISW